MSVISLEEWRKKLEDISNSTSPSKQSSMLDGAGETLTDDQKDGTKAVYMVLAMARLKPFTTKSTMARDAATEIALCASEGFLTTKVNDVTFSNVWMVTARGLEYMEECEDVLSD